MAHSVHPIRNRSTRNKHRKHCGPEDVFPSDDLGSCPEAHWMSIYIYIWLYSLSYPLYNTWGCCFQFTHFLVMIEMMYIFCLITIIGSMNYYPLFRVRSWNNGVCCMSFYIVMDISKVIIMTGMGIYLNNYLIGAEGTFNFAHHFLMFLHMVILYKLLIWVSQNLAFFKFCNYSSPGMFLPYSSH